MKIATMWILGLVFVASMLSGGVFITQWQKSRLWVLGAGLFYVLAFCVVVALVMTWNVWFIQSPLFDFLRR